MDGGWFNGKGYATLAKDKNNMKPICSYCHVDDYTRVSYTAHLRWRIACFICESIQHLKAQCPDSPWNRKKSVTRTNIELIYTKQGALVLKDTQEVDAEMSKEHEKKPDNTSITDDKDEFQEAISTLGSVDEENIDGNNLSTQNNKDSSQKKIDRNETTRRLLHPLITANNPSMNMQKHNKPEAFTPTSAVEKATKNQPFSMTVYK